MQQVPFSLPHTIQHNTTWLYWIGSKVVEIVERKALCESENLWKEMKLQRRWEVPFWSLGTEVDDWYEELAEIVGQ